MTEAQTLYLVLALVYLSECVLWLPRGAVAFRARGGGRFRPANSLEWAANDAGGFVLGPPLPPLDFLVGCGAPISFSPRGIASEAPRRLGLAPPAPPRFVAYDAIEGVLADGPHVVVNGERFVRALTPGQARRLAGRILRLAEADLPRREALLREDAEKSCDPGPVLALVERFERGTLPLAVASNLLFLAVFVLTPLSTRFLPLLRTWPIFALLIVASAAAAVVAFRRAHRAFHPEPEARAERRKLSFVLAISPPAAMRARDACARDLVADADPLGAAAALLPAEEFPAFAARAWRDLRFPSPAGEGGSADARAAVAWHRALLLERTAALLRARGLDPEALAAPPDRAGADDRSYCPRCRALFALAEGRCDDCGGVALVSLPPAAPPGR